MSRILGTAIPTCIQVLYGYKSQSRPGGRSTSSARLCKKTEALKAYR